jgi:long-chain acyl-CoA synthetase
MHDLKPRTIKNLFETSLQKFGDEIACGFVDEKPLTYQEIGENVYKLSDALKARGVKKGDRVAILSENGPRWGIVYFASAVMGAINIPILPDFHKSEVHHILRNSGATVLFVSSKLVHKVADANLADIKHIVSMDDLPLMLNKKKVENLQDLLTGKAKVKKALTKIVKDNVKEKDIAEILYTSGTTGHSKGVILTHYNITSNALSATNHIDIRSTDRFLSILPMPHSYECTCGFIAPFMMGSKVFYIKGLPTAQTLLPAVKVIKPTIILSVPLIMDKIYKKKVLPEINANPLGRALYKIKPMRKKVHAIAGKKLYEAFGGELRFMVFGGAATPYEVEVFLTDGGFPYVTGYGLTEAAPLLTANPWGQQRQQSAGKIVPEVQIRIDDPDPKTGIGEIVATGPNIMKGYYRNEEATSATFTKDGWLITGDRGYIDPDGFLFIKGRSKNLIVGPSGENIYPEEIEFHLSQNPFVLESLVYDKEGKILAKVYLDYDAIDKEYGTSKMDESEASKIIDQLIKDIKSDVNSRVATYSRVHQIFEQQEEFEKTPTKKIKRYLYTS